MFHGNFGSELLQNTPPPPKEFGTSHQRLRDFGSELLKSPTPKLELLMEDLGTSVLNLPESPLQKTYIVITENKELSNQINTLFLNEEYPHPIQIGTSHGGLQVWAT